MTLTTQIQQTVKQIPEGVIFGYKDLLLQQANYVSVAKVLERLNTKGEVKKISNGKFYKPVQSVFGELKPDRSEVLRSYLFEDGKRIAYETGTALYNRMGLTTQMSFQTKIACRGKRITIDLEDIQATGVNSYADVTDENYKTLGLLDAFKDIKRIPDCPVPQAIDRLREIVRELTDEKKKELIKYALLYPPRVRALVGAILEELGSEKMLIPLKESLNPFTKINLGIDSVVLSTKENWNIV